MNYINDWGNKYQPESTTWKDIKELFKKIESWGNYKDIIKGFLAYELCTDNNETLERIYDAYMYNDFNILDEYYYQLKEEIEGKE